jgi:hypothetical protein
MTGYFLFKTELFSYKTWDPIDIIEIQTFMIAHVINRPAPGRNFAFAIDALVPNTNNKSVSVVFQFAVLLSECRKEFEN